MEAKVHAYVDKNYPRSVTGWICHASWERNSIPLKAIAYHNRPGGRDMNKVAKMAAKLKDGWKPKRVVLVDPGLTGKMVVCDGYHRLLGMHDAGVKKVRAYVGTPRPGAGDWRADILAMQREVLNAAGAQNQAVKSRATLEPGDEVSGARSRPANVVQVPTTPDSYRIEDGVLELYHFTPLEVTSELPADVQQD